MSEKKNDHLDFQIEEVEFEEEEKQKSKKSLDIPVIEKRMRRMESERNLAPHQEEEAPNFLEAYGRYIIIGVVAVILVVVLVLIGTSLFGSSHTGTEAGSTDAANTTEESTEESTQAPLDTSLQLSDDPEVNALMVAFYKANLDCDLETVHSLVEDDSQFTLENLQKKREYIENYLNVTCYTKPGVNDDEYVLYVYSEIKFANIDTAAPQLNRYYLNRSSEGKLVLANGVITSEKVEHMTKMDGSNDVLELVDSVYNRLTDAMESDEKLYDLIQLLNSVVDPETTESASETETTEAVQGSVFYVNDELFHRTDEMVYVKASGMEVTVFASNSKTSEVLGYLYFGDYVVRTGYSDEWSQIEYLGKTAYVYKGQLTTERP